MFTEEKQRIWEFACILSWIFFVVVILSCFGLIEFSGVRLVNSSKMILSHSMKYGKGIKI